MSLLRYAHQLYIMSSSSTPPPLPRTLVPALFSLVLILQVCNASPVSGNVLAARQEFDWPKCNPQPAGKCTVYIATSDDSSPNGYRTTGLFDNTCTLTQAFKTIKTNPKITLRGHLPLYVDLHVDDYIRPKGWLSYGDSDTPVGDADTSTMECYKIPGTDGVSCRVAFDCS